jgi:signal transduction histidine kinase/CheY-like chemotaxis protein
MSASGASQTDLALRALVLTPVGRDASLTREALDRAGFASSVCSDIAELCQEVPKGAGLALIASEAVSADGAGTLLKCLEVQPPWSDLPIILLLSGPIARSNLLSLDPLKARKNVTFLSRPVPVLTLISAAQAAIASRQRQYAVRDLLDELAVGVRRRDEFLAMLGHELRNPLAAIRNAVELLEANDTQGRSSHAFEKNVLERQSRHLARIVGDLLDVSRVTSGRLVLKRERLDLVRAARLAADDVRLTLDPDGHRLSLDLPHEAIPVDADPTRIDQVIKNLVVNAFHHNGARTKVVLSVRRRGDQAELAVADDGVGMSSELLSRVFELFSQARIGSGGLGLGLSLSQRLAQMHGGELTAASRGSGQGSEFVLRLPLSGEPKARPSAAAPAVESPLRIVLVDDDPDVADSLLILLARSGHEVHIARDGRRGIEMAKQLQPDAVLLDIGLPDISGLEVARALRREEVLSDTVIIALSGFAQDEDRRESRKAGCDRHLTKPVELAELRRLLAQVAASSRETA